MRKIMNNEILLNKPINSDKEDLIGFETLVNDLDKAIENGAQTIAITSNYGSGKSSLIKLYEEKNKDKPKEKKHELFYVNMGSYIEDEVEGSEYLHKNFIYNLSKSIEPKKSTFISRALSENYRIFNSSFFDGKAKASLIIVAFLFIIEYIALKYKDYVFDFAKTAGFNSIDNIFNYTIIGVFIAILFIIVVTFFNIDFAIPNKFDSEKRQIHEHEIISIYNQYIVPLLSKKEKDNKVIIVIEDIDRTKSNKNVYKFLKEFKKNYVGSLDNVVFIVNLKPEGILVNETSDKSEALEKVYSKIFDYIIDLKTINYDNYDIILKGILNSLSESLSLVGYDSVWKDDEQAHYSDEFEWIIRSDNKTFTIRDIKERLNYGLSIYKSLKSKNPSGEISKSKCMVSAYLSNEFPIDYYKMIELGIDKFIDNFFKNNKDLDIFVSSLLQESFSEKFLKVIYELIESKLIDTDYRNYFYNLPKDSYFYNSDEIKLNNIILYNEHISLTKESIVELEALANNVNNSNRTIIANAYSRLDRLNLPYPKSTLLSKTLLSISIKQNVSSIYKLIDSLDYEEGFNKTLIYLLEALKNNEPFNNEEFRSRIFKNIVELCTTKNIIVFRDSIRNINHIPFIELKILYFEDCPLIISDELKNEIDKENIFKLINYDSPLFDKSYFESVLKALELLDVYDNKQYRENMIIFLLKSLDTLQEDLEHVVLSIIKFMFDNCFLNIRLEKAIAQIIDNSEINENYIDLLNFVSENNIRFNDETIENIKIGKITSGLNIDACNELLINNEFNLYVLNMFAAKQNLKIDYSSDNIKKTIKKLNFDNNKNYLNQARDGVLKCRNCNLLDYKFLFSNTNDIISESELFMISNTITGLSIIDMGQLDISIIGYIAKYINRKTHTVKDANSIMVFICSINDVSLQRRMFELIDFIKLHFSNISNNKKEKIIATQKAYDISMPEDAIDLLANIKTSIYSVEKAVNKYLPKTSTNGTYLYMPSYIEYVQEVDKVSNEIIDNLLSVDVIYPFDDRITDEFRKRNMFEYYVVSKSRNRKRLFFDKLDSLLYETYVEIFKGNKYSDIIDYMKKDKNFVQMMIDKKEYIGVEGDLLLRFANAKQTKDSLEYASKFNEITMISRIPRIQQRNLFESYLSLINSLDDEAESLFMEIMKSDEYIAGSEKIYSNIYNHLNRGNKISYSFRHKRNK